MNGLDGVSSGTVGGDQAQAAHGPVFDQAKFEEFLTNAQPVVHEFVLIGLVAASVFLKNSGTVAKAAPLLAAISSLAR